MAEKKICSELSQTETAFVEIYFGGLGWVRSIFFSPPLFKFSLGGGKQQMVGIFVSAKMEN